MRGILLLASIFVSCPLGSASAQEESVESADEREEQARAVFQAGRVAYGNGDFESALEYFRRALELSDRPALLFNVGMAATQLRRDREALEAFEAFLEAEPDAPNAAQVRARIEVLRRSLQAEPEPEAEPGQPAGGDLVPALVAFGAAGAGLVAFAITGGLALAQSSELEGRCGATRTCSDAEVASLAGLATAADVSWVLAATAAAAGVVLLVTVGLPTSRAEQSARVVPWVSPDGGGVVSEVRF